MNMNEYQTKFLEYIAAIQDDNVEITLIEHDVDEKERQRIRELLLDATSGVIVEMMELIDGYTSFTNDKLDIINRRTGEGLKENPPIELHDAICDFIKTSED